MSTKGMEDSKAKLKVFFDGAKAELEGKMFLDGNGEYTTRHWDVVLVLSTHAGVEDGGLTVNMDPTKNIPITDVSNVSKVLSL